MRLRRGPVRTEILHATKQEIDFLYNLLKVEVPGGRFTKAARHGWDGYRKFVRRKKVFPTGLFHMVERSLPSGWTLDVEDSFDFPSHHHFEPHGYQMTGKWAFQREAVRRCLWHGRGLIHTATNSGKTVVMATVAGSYADSSVLILVHSIEILKQLVDAFRGALQEPVGRITSGVVDLLRKRVVVGMIKTLYQRILDEDDLVMDYFGNAKVLIIDEGHHLRSPTYQFVMEQSLAPVRLGFSGTIPAEDTLAGMLIRAVTGPVLMRLRNVELVQLGISAEPTIYMLQTDTTFPVLSKKLRGIKRYNVIERIGIVENDDRNHMILELMKRFKGRGVVVVINVVAHGRHLLDMARAGGLRAEFLWGGARQRDRIVTDFKAGRLKTLISSKVIDEGINTDKIEVLVMGGGRKSSEQQLQRMGRGFRTGLLERVRKKTLLICDFMDKGQFLSQHSHRRKKTFENEGFKTWVVASVGEVEFDG